MDWMRVMEFVAVMLILIALVLFLASRLAHYPVCHTCGNVLKNVPLKARVAWCDYCNRARDVLWEQRE